MDSQSVISRSFARTPVGRKSVHHPDFETLVEVNREVVSLTGEPHGYSEADGRKLEALVKEVELRADNQEFAESVSEKAALLTFKLASGQYFRAGNRRTALVAGIAFLSKNGFNIGVADPELVTTVDKAGIAAATLDDLYEVIQRLVKKTPVERKGWDRAVAQLVEANRDALTKLGS